MFCDVKVETQLSQSFWLNVVKSPSGPCWSHPTVDGPESSWTLMIAVWVLQWGVKSRITSSWWRQQLWLGFLLFRFGRLNAAPVRLWSGFGAQWWRSDSLCALLSVWTWVCADSRCIGGRGFTSSTSDASSSTSSSADFSSGGRRACEGVFRMRRRDVEAEQVVGNSRQGAEWTVVVVLQVSEEQVRLHVLLQQHLLPADVTGEHAAAWRSRSMNVNRYMSETPTRKRARAASYAWGLRSSSPTEMP